MVLLFEIPIKFYSALHNGNFCASTAVCRLLVITDFTFCCASITNILAISVNRYIAVTRVFKVKHIYTPFRTKCFVIIIWLYSIIWGILINVNAERKTFDAIEVSHYKCGVWRTTAYATVQYTIMFFLPSLAMLGLYAKILCI